MEENQTIESCDHFTVCNGPLIIKSRVEIKFSAHYRCVSEKNFISYAQRLIFQNRREQETQPNNIAKICYGNHSQSTVGQQGILKWYTSLYSIFMTNWIFGNFSIISIRMQHKFLCIFLTGKCLQINVREYRRGNKKNWLSRETGYIGYTRRRKTKQKHKTICVGRHYAQTNTNNVNNTRALLQTTGGSNVHYI